MGLTEGVLLALPNVAIAGEEEPLPAFAATATVSAVTDYVSRGLSQTDGAPAVQGTLELGYQLPDKLPRLYVGAFASNIDLPGADVELDAYWGASGPLGGLHYNVFGLYYAYPDAERSLNFQFWEAGAKLSWLREFVAITVGVLYSPSFFADSGDQYYPFATAQVPFRLFDHSWSVTGEFSRRLIERNEGFGLPDYSAWLLSLNTALFGIEFSLLYADTNIPEKRCPTKICDPRVVFRVTKGF